MQHDASGQNQTLARLTPVIQTIVGVDASGIFTAALRGQLQLRSPPGSPARKEKTSAHKALVYAQLRSVASPRTNFCLGGQCQRSQTAQLAVNLILRIAV